MVLFHYFNDNNNKYLKLEKKNFKLIKLNAGIIGDWAQSPILISEK